MNTIQQLTMLYVQLHNIRMVLLLIAVILTAQLLSDMVTTMLYTNRLSIKIAYLLLVLFLVVASYTIKGLLI